METRSLTLSLPKEVWDLLQRQDVPLEQAIARALSESRNAMGHSAPQAMQDVEQSLCELKSQLNYKFENARSWAELQGRLKRSGFTLRDGGQGLTLADAETKEQICALTRLNIAEKDLVARFGRPFPKATHRWKLEEALEHPTQQRPLSSREERPAATARRG